MASYLLRNIDTDLWKRFRYRTQYDGIPARQVLIEAIRAYLDGPGGPPATLTVEVSRSAIRDALLGPTAGVATPTEPSV